MYINRVLCRFSWFEMHNKNGKKCNWLQHMPTTTKPVKTGWSSTGQKGLKTPKMTSIILGHQPVTTGWLTNNNSTCYNWLILNQLERLEDEDGEYTEQCALNSIHFLAYIFVLLHHFFVISFKHQSCSTSSWIVSRGRSRGGEGGDWLPTSPFAKYVNCL